MNSEKRKIWFKVLTLALVIQLTAGTALAYFIDAENSDSNAYLAGTLDFSLNSTGDASQKNISVVNNGSLGFQYSVEAIKIAGDDDFCNALDLTATLNSNLVYTGKLMDFFSTTTFATSSGNVWSFQNNLPVSQIYFNKKCEFKFNFIAWQENLASSSQGFWDQEEDNNILTSPEGPKINKVYYDVDDNHGNEDDNEWIELYNPNSFDINLKDWQICDNNNCRNIETDTIISGLGFVVVSNNASTWNYWDIPSQVPKIQLSGSLFLSNSGDMLLLKDATGFVVDEMNWGDNTVDEGHMLSRVPNGFDTDQPSDFHDLALPQIVVSPIGGEIFCDRCNFTGPIHCAPIIYNGSPLDVNWTATNPNGADSELLIDLYYIIDKDCSGDISLDDQIYVIDKNLPNNGFYSWYPINPFYHGLVWIKAIVHGPENIMLSSSIISNSGFEPSFGEVSGGCFPTTSSDTIIEEQLVPVVEPTTEPTTEPVKEPEVQTIVEEPEPEKTNE